jgi:tRNA threonylcarbamoyladenosine biosynthesis protein TsaE
MVTFISKAPEETLALGEIWGKLASNGWLIGLSGELGAGKTQLVRGIAAGLGCTSRVHSPTFTLLNEYEGGRLKLTHLDLFRLTDPAHIVAAGLEDYFTPAGVAVVEWIERWTAGQSADSRIPSGVRYRRVKIAIVGEKERHIGYEDIGD